MTPKEKTTPSGARSPVIIFLLFALFFVLRLMLISKGPYNIDCLNLARTAQASLEDHRLYYMTGTGYPLTVLLGVLFIGLAKTVNVHDPVLAINFMSVFWSSCTLIPFYGFVSRLIHSRAALFSSLMLCVLPVFLSLSVYGKSFAPAYFFLFCGLFWLFRFFNVPNRRFLLLSGFAWGAMSATRLQDAVIALIPSTILLLYHLFHSPTNSRRHPFSDLWAFLWPVFSITIFFHAPFLLSDLRADYLTQVKWYFNVNANQPGLKNFFASLKDPLNTVFFVLSPVGFLAALIGFIKVFQTRKRTAVFLALWVLSAVFFLGGRLSLTARYLMPVFFPLLIAQGAFFAFLTGFRNRPFQAAAILSFSLILGLLTKETLPPLQFRHNHALLPDAARHFAGTAGPAALVIAGDEGLFLVHYGQLTLLQRPKPLNPVPDSTLDKFRQDLDKKLFAGIPVYITSSGLYSYDPQQQFSRFMKKHYRFEYLTEHPSEDWHHSGIRSRIGTEKFFRVRPRIDRGLLK